MIFVLGSPHVHPRCNSKSRFLNVSCTTITNTDIYSKPNNFGWFHTLNKCSFPKTCLWLHTFTSLQTTECHQLPLTVLVILQDLWQTLSLKDTCFGDIFFFFVIKIRYVCHTCPRAHNWGFPWHNKVCFLTPRVCYFDPWVCYFDPPSLLFWPLVCYFVPQI